MLSQSGNVHWYTPPALIDPGLLFFIENISYLITLDKFDYTGDCISIRLWVRTGEIIMQNETWGGKS